jgi:hypothetical protein
MMPGPLALLSIKSCGKEVSIVRLVGVVGDNTDHKWKWNLWSVLSPTI